MKTIEKLIELPNGDLLDLFITLHDGQLTTHGIPETTPARTGQISGVIEISIQQCAVISKILNNKEHFENYMKWMILWSILKIDRINPPDSYIEPHKIYSDIETDAMCIDWFKKQDWSFKGIIKGFDALAKVSPPACTEIEKRKTKIIQNILK